MVFRHSMKVAKNVATLALGAQKTYFFITIKAFCFVFLSPFCLPFILVCLILLFFRFDFRCRLGLTMYFTCINICIRITRGAHSIIGWRSPKLFTFDAFNWLWFFLFYFLWLLLTHGFNKTILIDFILYYMAIEIINKNNLKRDSLYWKCIC